MSQSSTNASSTNTNTPSTPQSQNPQLSGFANFTTQIPQFSPQQQSAIMQNFWTSAQQQQQPNPNQIGADFFNQLFFGQPLPQQQFQPQQIPQFSQPPTQTEIVEETQPPQIQDTDAGPSQGRKKKASKKFPWTTDEEELLAKCWIHISEDSDVANNQPNNYFWNRVLASYNEQAAELGLIERNKDQLTSKFTALSASVKKFIGHYAEAVRLRTSGSDDASVKEAAHEMYRNAEAAVFKYEKVWAVLRDKSRWRNFARVEDPTVNLDDVNIDDDIMTDDPLPRPVGKSRSGKRKEPSTDSETAQSQSSSFCSSVLDQIKKITRTKKAVAKEKKEVLKASKQTQYALTRKEDLAFLQTSTEGMSELDAQWVESEKHRIRVKYGIITE